MLYNARYYKSTPEELELMLQLVIIDNTSGGIFHAGQYALQGVSSEDSDYYIQN